MITKPNNVSLMFTDCYKTFSMRIFHFLCELASFTVTDLQASIYLGLHLEHRTSNQDRQAHTEYIVIKHTKAQQWMKINNSALQCQSNTKKKMLNYSVIRLRIELWTALIHTYWEASSDTTVPHNNYTSSLTA